MEPIVDKQDSSAAERPEGMSPLVVGYTWVVRITTFCMEFAALALLGRFLDVRYNFEPWGLIVGCFLGLYVFIAGLIDAVKRADASSVDD